MDYIVLLDEENRAFNIYKIKMIGKVAVILTLYEEKVVILWLLISKYYEIKKIKLVLKNKYN